MLTIVGDATANSIVVTADAVGSIRLFDGATEHKVPNTRAVINISDLKSLIIDGRSGNDRIFVDKSLNTLDANGKLAFAPNAVMVGGAGNDVLVAQIGGFVGGEPIEGQPPPVTVGTVVQIGGAGNDTLIGGGPSVFLGGQGNDTMVWLAGATSLAVDGGPGVNSVILVSNDSTGSDLALRPNPTNPGGLVLEQTNLVPFSIALNGIQKVVPDVSAGSSLGVDPLLRLVAGSKKGDCGKKCSPELVFLLGDIRLNPADIAGAGQVTIG